MAPSRGSCKLAIVMSDHERGSEHSKSSVDNDLASTSAATRKVHKVLETWQRRGSQCWQDFSFQFRTIRAFIHLQVDDEGGEKINNAILGLDDNDINTFAVGKSKRTATRKNWLCSGRTFAFVFLFLLTLILFDSVRGQTSARDGSTFTDNCRCISGCWPDGSCISGRPAAGAEIPLASEVEHNRQSTEHPASVMMVATSSSDEDQHRARLSGSGSEKGRSDIWQKNYMHQIDIQNQKVHHDKTPHHRRQLSTCTASGFICSDHGETSYCQSWQSDTVCNQGSCDSPANCLSSSSTNSNSNKKSDGTSW